MNIYILISIIIAIVAICTFVYYNSYTKLKTYNDKINNASSIINENLNKKLDLIIDINTEIKKITNKKNYLKDYINLKNSIVTDIEKDWKLNEAVKLINNLALDYGELSKDKKYKEIMNNIRKIDETITSAKNVYNNNAIKSNRLIKTFPNSIVAKISHYNIRTYFTNKNDETF